MKQRRGTVQFSNDAIDWGGKFKLLRGIAGRGLPEGVKSKSTDWPGPEDSSRDRQRFFVLQNVLSLIVSMVRSEATEAIGVVPFGERNTFARILLFKWASIHQLGQLVQSGGIQAFVSERRSTE